MSVRPVAYVAVPLLSTVVLLAAGCSSGVEDLVARPAADKADDTADDARPSPPPPPPPPPSAPANQPEQPEADAADRQGGPPVEPVMVPPTATVPEPPAAKPQAAPTTAKLPAAPSIRLSAGVALAQTLPTGTAMGFSVDYEFTEGQPNPRSSYVWVIEPGKGPPAKFMVRLSSKDNLMMFVPKWRPENGPFQTHLEDTRGNRLSDSLPLR